MPGMSRLSSWIVRRDPVFSRSSLRGPAAPAAAAMALSRAGPFAGAEPAVWLEDLKLFATGWIGGLIFFGTLLG